MYFELLIGVFFFDFVWNIRDKRALVWSKAHELPKNQAWLRALYSVIAQWGIYLFKILYFYSSRAQFWLVHTYWNSFSKAKFKFLSRLFKMNLHESVRDFKIPYLIFGISYVNKSYEKPLENILYKIWSGLYDKIFQCRQVRIGCGVNYPFGVICELEKCNLRNFLANS